jgi:hypothetical protein
LENYVASEPPNRAASFSTLWRIDPGNAVVFRQVETFLRSNEWEMDAACDVICQMKREGARFVPLLVEQLEKHWEYCDFCWAAVDALGEIGPGAREARPMLEKLRSHPSGLVKARASEALSKIV